jgi:hypothetical protein
LKLKLLITALLFTSLIGYLEWGKNNSIFLIEAEWEIIKKVYKHPQAIMHPMVLFPMLGQLLLIIALFKPLKKIILLAISCIALLFVFMFIIAVVSINIKILLAVLPFLIFAIYTIYYLRKISLAHTTI